jgi:hypothetical protein
LPPPRYEPPAPPRPDDEPYTRFCFAGNEPRCGGRDCDIGFVRRKALLSAMERLGTRATADRIDLAGSWCQPQRPQDGQRRQVLREAAPGPRPRGPRPRHPRPLRRQALQRQERLWQAYVHRCSERGRERTGVADKLAAIVHAIAFLLVIGYAQNYYFHLREYRYTQRTRRPSVLSCWENGHELTVLHRSPQEQRPLEGDLGV